MIFINRIRDNLQKIMLLQIRQILSLVEKYRYPLVLAFLVALFNQFSGINAFLYYAPRIFEIAGLEKSGA